MGKMIKRIAIALVVLTLGVSVGYGFISQPNIVFAATNIAALKGQYPNGSKWNGSYKNKAWQCHGWACLIGDALTGTDPYTWKKVYNLDSLKAGDIVRFKRPHSIIIQGVSGDTITYADCNWVAANTVKWDQTVQRGSMMSKFGSLDYVMVAPGAASSGANVEISSGTAANSNADDIRYNVEKPADGLECSDDIKLEGWFIYRSGDVSEVVCYLNGAPICNCERIQRPDVSSAFPGYSANEGFRCNISKELFKTGQNQIFFRAYTNGNTRVVADFGHRTITYQPRELRFYMEDLPNDLVTTGEVGGWAIADSAVRIAIVLNGVEFEVTDRQERPDVKAVFPSYDVSQAGFRYVIDASQVMHGTNHLSVRAYTSDTQYTEIYNGTFQAIVMDPALFDFSYYYARYSVSDSIVKAIGRNYSGLLKDYFTRTLALGYEPSMAFSPAYYLRENADIAAAYGADNYVGAYIHFVEYVLNGNGNELRRTSPYLDLLYYKTKYIGELGGMSPGELISHYIIYGGPENRRASGSDESAAFCKLYNAKEYAKSNPDIAEACGDGTTFESKKNLWSNFFLYQLGANNARATSQFFDFRYVTETYKMTTQQAFEWYILGGGFASGNPVKKPETLLGILEGIGCSANQNTEVGNQAEVSEKDNNLLDMPDDAEESITQDPETEEPIFKEPDSRETDAEESTFQESEEYVSDEEKSESADLGFEEEREQEQATFYRVTFKSNGKVTAEQKVAEGTLASVPNTPARKGYFFVGWYLGKSPYDFESEVTGNLTVAAKWKKVSVGKAAVKSLKRGRGQFNISYKAAGAEGYEIQYATNKKFTKNTVKKITRKTVCKITGLKEKCYYIRIRAYTIDSAGKRVYGKWSKVKMLKMKD